jgi:hypothetical protein
VRARAVSKPLVEVSVLLGISLGGVWGGAAAPKTYQFE